MSENDAPDPATDCKVESAQGDWEVENAQEFRSALETLVEDASRNDIPLEQHWPCRTNGDVPDWDVEIVRVASCEGDRE